MYNVHVAYTQYRLFVHLLQNMCRTSVAGRCTTRLSTWMSATMRYMWAPCKYIVGYFWETQKTIKYLSSRKNLLVTHEII